MPGLTGGAETYDVDWIGRSFLIPFIRSEGIDQLQMQPGLTLNGLNGPDDGKRRQKIARLVRLVQEENALKVFRKLHYKGPPELFCMWLCLLDPKGKTGKGQKRKREASSGPNGRHFLASGRVFMTPSEFLTKEKLITNPTAPGFSEVVSHKYAKTETLVIPDADPSHYTRQLPASLVGKQIWCHAEAGFFCLPCPGDLLRASVCIV